jgi:hypothetical protein
MNTALLITTIVAIAAAAAAIIAMCVAFRRERRRSEARVVALRQMAGGADLSDAIETAPNEPYDFATYEHGAEARPMFSEAAETSPWRRRVAAAVVTAAVVTAVGYVLLSRGNSTEPHGSAAAAATSMAPLELLSLRHNQENGRLVITGLVQNPRAGAPLTRIIATAFLFGADGAFLASGRAPLDFSTLGAGDESPFVITVPVATAVARYRVGFRGADGRVIAHVDRRATGTLARTAE